MIITRTPFRIPLGGGGTDLPSYYEKYGGFFVSAAVDKYMFITLNHSFRPEIHLRYSRTEHVPLGKFEAIEHPVIREVLRLTDLKCPIEITSMADILAETGVGSSGSFTVGLLKSIYAHKRQHASAREIAEQACNINMNVLKTGSGKQDEYIASYGGITCFDVNTAGEVKIEPLRVPANAVYDLEEKLLMFFTGFTRSSSVILKQQESDTLRDDKNVIDNLHRTKELGYRVRDALKAGDNEQFAIIMHEHWENKKRRSEQMSNPLINQAYESAMQNGALGGKLMGAGGGGFLLFYAPEPRKLRNAMTQMGLNEIRFRFDFEGSKVISNSEQYRDQA